MSTPEFVETSQIVALPFTVNSYEANTNYGIPKNSVAPENTTVNGSMRVDKQIPDYPPNLSANPVLEQTGVEIPNQTVKGTIIAAPMDISAPDNGTRTDVNLAGTTEALQQNNDDSGGNIADRQENHAVYSPPDSSPSPPLPQLQTSIPTDAYCPPDLDVSTLATLSPLITRKDVSRRDLPLVCHVLECNAPLQGQADYYQRYRICKNHLRAPVLLVDNVPQRFCQQCGRFHTLDAFDSDKRNCRARLAQHNSRRRKAGATSTQAALTLLQTGTQPQRKRVPTSLYDEYDTEFNLGYERSRPRQRTLTSKAREAPGVCTNSRSKSSNYKGNSGSNYESESGSQEDMGLFDALLAAAMEDKEGAAGTQNNINDNNNIEYSSQYTAQAGQLHRIVSHSINDGEIYPQYQHDHNDQGLDAYRSGRFGGMPIGSYTAPPTQTPIISPQALYPSNPLSQLEQLLGRHLLNQLLGGAGLAQQRTSFPPPPPPPPPQTNAAVLLDALRSVIGGHSIQNGNKATVAAYKPPASIPSALLGSSPSGIAASLRQAPKELASPHQVNIDTLRQLIAIQGAVNDSRLGNMKTSASTSPVPLHSVPIIKSMPQVLGMKSALEQVQKMPNTINYDHSALGAGTRNPDYPAHTDSSAISENLMQQLASALESSQQQDAMKNTSHYAATAPKPTTSHQAPPASLQKLLTALKQNSTAGTHNQQQQQQQQQKGNGLENAASQLSLLLQAVTNAQNKQRVPVLVPASAPVPVEVGPSSDIKPHSEILKTEPVPYANVQPVPTIEPRITR